MNPTSVPSRFPLGPALSLLTAAALLLAGVNYGLVGWNWPQAPVRSLTLFAGLVVWGSAILALMPVVLLCRRGVMPTVYGYFIGMALRLPLCLSAAIFAAKAGYLPGKPLLVALVIFYFPLLLMEVGLVGRYLWAQDARRMPPTISRIQPQETPA